MMRYSRQSFLGAGSEKLLANLCVGVVGLGGGGSHIVQQLAHLGVGNFVLFDPDTVEESNLNRLVGATADDARRKAPKAQIAQRAVLRVNPDATMSVNEVAWHERGELLRTCDIIFGCLDSFAARDELERAARRYLIPYLDIGMDVFETANGYSISGQIALSIPGRPCLRCMNVIQDKFIAQEAAQYGQAGYRPQVVWSNGVLASTAVGLFVSFTFPWHSSLVPAPLLIEYDGNANSLAETSTRDYLASRRCPHFDSIEELGDPWFRFGPAPEQLA